MDPVRWRGGMVSAATHKSTPSTAPSLPFLFSPTNYGNGSNGYNGYNGGSGYNGTNGSSSSLGRQTKAMFLYGAGADIPASSHVSVRAEFRSLGYKAPDFGL